MYRDTRLVGVLVATMAMCAHLPRGTLTSKLSVSVPSALPLCSAPEGERHLADTMPIFPLHRTRLRRSFGRISTS